MSRIVRFREPSQPTLPLGHGPVHWHTLPLPVRDRVLALWMQLLSEYLSHQGRFSAGAVHAVVPANTTEEVQ